MSRTADKIKSSKLPQVNSESRVPRYLQAKTILANAIRRGEFAPGSKLPNTSEIGAMLDVSLITAHKAIHCLVSEGWLIRERGRGTFVRGNFEASVAAKPRFRIALVLPTANPIEDFYHGNVLQGIRRGIAEAEKVGELVIQRFDRLTDLDTIDADGLLYFHPSRENYEYLEDQARWKPIVVIGGSTDETTLHCVDSQNTNGTRRAVQHLVSLGHERIAVVNGPLTSTNCLHRFEGYVAEMQAQGLPIRGEYIFNAEMAQSAGAVMDRLSEAMHSRERPTAIIACGYYLALEVLTLLQELDIRVPDDVSLVGFDDPKSANLLNPPLTTIRQPLEEMGAQAYKMVVDLIEGKELGFYVKLLPTELILRKSTGPIRVP